MLPQKVARMMKRRVPPEKRQRTEMSCDHCKAKRTKCLRSSTAESCLSCTESGKPCRTTIPRKERSYGRASSSHNADHGSNEPASYPPQPTQYISPTSTIDPDPRPRSLCGSTIETGGRGVDMGETVTGTRTGSASAERLFEDDLGLPRYVGPTGSYTFMVKLREIMAVKCAPKTAGSRYAQTMGRSVKLFDVNGKQTMHLPPREASDALVELFFTKVHCDFPTFHRAIFQTSYENMWSLTPHTEPAWLMALGMVFVLGLDAAPDGALPMLSQGQRKAMKENYVSMVKELLPDVLSGCTLSHVQAIMLYCRHLYISGDRNSSWSLAGAAIRIAIAIGLHRNGVNPRCNPLEREMRKRVWWTLYAFERIECSSLGRASAIDDEECNVGYPTEGLLDMSDTIPLRHIAAQSQLLTMLGTICKQQYRLNDLSQRQVNVSNTILQKLNAWYHNLPTHLRLESGFPESHCRAITLLHVQYHYTVTLLCRPFLIAKVTKSHSDSSESTFITDHARKCVDSAKTSIRLLQKLSLEGRFNAKTWWDVFFVKSSSMMLALGAIVEDANFDPNGEALSCLKTCLTILSTCDGFSPTMKSFATVATDLGRAMVDTAESTGGIRKTQQKHPPYWEDSSLPRYDSTTTVENDSELSEFGSRVADGVAEASLLEKFPDDWELAGISDHLNWDDIESWTIQP